MPMNMPTHQQGAAPGINASFYPACPVGKLPCGYRHMTHGIVGHGEGSLYLR